MAGAVPRRYGTRLYRRRTAHFGFIARASPRTKPLAAVALSNASEKASKTCTERRVEAARRRNLRQQGQGAGFTSMRFTGTMGLLPGKTATVVVKNNRRLENCRRPHRYRPGDGMAALGLLSAIVVSVRAQPGRHEMPSGCGHEARRGRRVSPAGYREVA